MAVRTELTYLDRSVVEETAKIMGPESSAAKALAIADAHDGETRFYFSGDAILIQKKAALTGQWWN